MIDNLLSKIKNAPDLDFGNIINDAIELFKKVWLKGFLAVLIIVAAAFCIVFLFSLIGLGTMNDPYLLDGDFTLEKFGYYQGKTIFMSIPQTILTTVGKPRSCC